MIQSLEGDLCRNLTEHGCLVRLETGASDLIVVNTYEEEGDLLPT